MTIRFHQAGSLQLIKNTDWFTITASTERALVSDFTTSAYKGSHVSAQTLKGGYRNFFLFSLGIIYGGKIVETARSDLKMTQKRKFGLF